VTARRRFPDPGALARARTLLLGAGVFVPVGTWEGLATICDSAWLPLTGRPSPAIARVVRRRLRRLASAPLTLVEAAARPRGEDVVHLRGLCAPLAFGDAATTLWRVERVRERDGLWLVEAHRDFVLTDPEGGQVVVVAAGGHLINGDVLRPGDEVSVFGFLDDIPDRTGLGRSLHARGGLVPALRSGAELPLLVSRVVR
jgi:hypothetical protein